AYDLQFACDLQFYRLDLKSDFLIILKFHIEYRQLNNLSFSVIACPAFFMVGASDYDMVVPCSREETKISLRGAAVRARMAVDRTNGFNVWHHIKPENCALIT